MSRPSFVVVVLIILATSAASSAQEVIPHHQDQPPGPALSPGEAIARMTVPPGFTVELVASEPDIVNPVAMTFDERGRIWITESLEYPRKAPGVGRDRVKVLQDTDGDGKADQFSVFAEGLNIPSGIAIGHGGVWVANSPDILFYPDADRDGRADGPPQTIVTGFGRTDTHELPNSLTWGPDGYLYGLNGVFNHSHVKYAESNPNFRADHSGWQFTCALFRIHPVTRTFEIFCEGTSNPWGLAFDHEGSAFISACVIDHLWHLTRTGYYHRQGGAYPPFTWKIESIVKHKHQKAAYCGLEYYDSDAYPEAYRNKLYMGNIHGGCLNVDKLERDGSTYFATPEPDFLTANDAWFMPVAQKTGPDGCLYVLDWYDRYHCYQDANRDSNGIDRLKGRLYRVRYQNTPRAKALDLAKETDEQLFERLASPNGFDRERAHRILIERRTSAEVTRAEIIDRTAEKVIFDKTVSIDDRLRALSVALALKQPRESLMTRLISDEDSRLRAWAFRSIGNQGASETLWAQVIELIDEPSPDAQLQLAIALGTSSRPDKTARLIELLAASGTDPLIPHIVWQNLHFSIGEEPEKFVVQVQKSTSPAVGAIIPRAVERILARDSAADAPLIVGLFNRARQLKLDIARDILTLLTSRVQNGEIKTDYVDRLQNAMRTRLMVLIAAKSDPLHAEAVLLATSWNDALGLAVAEKVLADRNTEKDMKSRALAAVVAASRQGANSKEVVLKFAAQTLADPSAKDLSAAVLGTLGKMDDPRVAAIVLKAYPSLAADVQPKSIELLTQRAAWAKSLVEAIANQQIASSVLNVNQVQGLLALNDKELTAAVNKHWGTIRTSRDPKREAMVAEMRKLVRNTPGDAHRGIAVFNRVCGQCHKIYGQGQDVGPDITANGRGSLEQLFSNVFDPSLVIGAAYQARTVLAADGRVVTGLLVEDSPQRIVLKIQGGKLETIARDDVDGLKVSELSLMPEGLEKQLQPQEIADLFAFISLHKHPDDPTARPLPAGPAGKK